MYQYGAGTNVGNVRDNNEDSYVCDEDKDLWVVADGMGGLGFGEVASAITTFTVTRHIREGHGVNQAIELAHKNIKEYAQSDGHGTNMGTTIVLLLSHGSLYNIFWVGDSRAYLYDAEGMKQVTVDHSLVQSLIEQGELTKEQAITDPRKNAVTRALGVQELDTVRADSISERWQPGQKIILCSDGLTDCVSDKDIEANIRRGGTDQEIVDRLIEAALAGGGKDNVTVIVVSAPSTTKAADTDTHVPGNLGRDDTHVPRGDAAPTDQTEINHRNNTNQQRNVANTARDSSKPTADIDQSLRQLSLDIDLHEPDLHEPDLHESDLHESDLREPDLQDTNSRDIETKASTHGAVQIPDLFSQSVFFDPIPLARKSNTSNPDAPAKGESAGTNSGRGASVLDKGRQLLGSLRQKTRDIIAGHTFSGDTFSGDKFPGDKQAGIPRLGLHKLSWQTITGFSMFATLVVVLGAASQKGDASADIPANFSAPIHPDNVNQIVEPIARSFPDVEFPTQGQVIQVGLFTRLSGAEELQGQLTSLGLAPHIEKRVTSEGSTSYAIVLGPLDDNLHQIAVTTLDESGHSYFHRQERGS